MKKEGSRVKKTGSEGEKERWRVEKKGRGEENRVQGWKKRLPEVFGQHFGWWFQILCIFVSPVLVNAKHSQWVHRLKYFCTVKHEVPSKLQLQFLCAWAN